MTGGRTGANLATLANGLCGVGAILYTLAGNKTWAILLIVSGVGFDGLDGFLARRAGAPPSRFGRIADSVADAITFGAAPAALLAVHTADVALWRSWTGACLAAALLVGALAVARLVYFTLRGYHRKDFLGVPTPTNALAISLAVVFLDTPGFLSGQPLALVSLSIVLALLMVAPIPFPKIRRGHALRLPMTATAVALVLALIPLQFHLARASPLYVLAELLCALAAVGLASYYLLGPFTVPKASSA